MKVAYFLADLWRKRQVNEEEVRPPADWGHQTFPLNFLKRNDASLPRAHASDGGDQVRSVRGRATFQNLNLSEDGISFHKEFVEKNESPLSLHSEVVAPYISHITPRFQKDSFPDNTREINPCLLLPERANKSEIPKVSPCISKN